MLVSISVLGILIAVLLPALTGARSAARASVCLSNLAQLSKLTSVYGQAYMDTYPFAESGQPLPIGPDAPSGTAVLVSTSHWATNSNWPSLMSYIVSWREAFPSWVCPGAPRATGRAWDPPQTNALGGSSYSYCRSFVARPSVWTLEVAPLTVGELSSTRISEVRFPSLKVQFFDAELAHLRRGVDTDADEVSRPVAFSDGHADSRIRAHALLPARNRALGSSRPWHDTKEGVWGRDH